MSALPHCFKDFESVSYRHYLLSPNCRLSRPGRPGTGALRLAEESSAWSFRNSPGDAPRSHGGPGGCGASHRGLFLFALASACTVGVFLWPALVGPARGSSSGVGPICRLQGVQKFLPQAGRGGGLLSGICQAWLQHLAPKSLCFAAVDSVTFPAAQTLKKKKIPHTYCCLSCTVWNWMLFSVYKLLVTVKLSSTFLNGFLQ